MIGFLQARGGELATLTLEHLMLVAVAIGVASAIGVPLGVLLTRREALAKPVMALANIAQTVPSLALFGFLIPLNLALFGIPVLGGIGPRTAVVALVLYALLPIIRGTYSGITGLDPAVRQAGVAMGMTDRQLLFRVELPLALPYIVSGLRVATVVTVGTATIAAAIDAGGLGKYIFRGLRMNDNSLILAGALSAAALALAADALLGMLERAFSPGRSAGKRLAVGLAAATATAMAVAAFWPQGAPAQLVVGAKDFTEQVILGELVAQSAERRGLTVRRRFDLGGNLAHEALVAGEIDCYIEYSGTALMAVLKETPGKEAASVLARVRAGYADKLDLVVGEPLGFNNTFAILVREADARQHGLTTVSQAARLTPGWTAGFGQDFMSRPDGYTGFSKAYGLRFAGAPREMDLSLTYRALRDGQVDMIAGNATDGLIARYGLVQLADDRGYFPPYDAVPVVRRDALARHPALQTVLADLAGRLDEGAMRRLNYAVDGEHKRPRDVVASFLDASAGEKLQ